MKRAVFARHGESEYSAAALLNGDVAVAVGLTRGRARAGARARRGAPRRAARPLRHDASSSASRLTADERARGRDVPRLVVPELNDPLYGPFEGGAIEEYRGWAAGAPSSDAPGRRRREPATRSSSATSRGFRIVLDRPEETILVVAHSLPIAYAARRARGPRARRAGAARPSTRCRTALDRRRARARASACSRSWLARADLVTRRLRNTVARGASSSGSTSTSAGTS